MEDARTSNRFTVLIRRVCRKNPLKNFHCINVMKIGYICKPSKEQNFDSSQEVQDGFISAIIVLCLMIALSLALVTSHFITFRHVDDRTSITDTCLKHLLNIYMLAAIVTMACMLTKRVKEQISVCTPGNVMCKSDNEDSDSQKCYSTCKWNYFQNSVVIFGLVCLTTFNAIADLLRAICHLTCIHEFHLASWKYTYVFAMKIVFGLLRMTLSIMQTCFCAIYYRRTFKRCALIRYGLVTILAASISNWVSSIAYDSAGIDHDFEIRYTNILPANISVRVGQCINESTPYYEGVRTFSEHVHPVTLRIHIFFLSIQIIFRRFFRAVDANEFEDMKREENKYKTQTASGVNNDDNVSVLDVRAAARIVPETSQDQGEHLDQNDDGQSNDGDQEPLITNMEIDNSTAARTQWEKCRKVLNYVVIAAFVAIFISHFVICRLDDIIDTWLETYAIYTSIILVLSVIASCIAIHCTNHCQLPLRKLPLTYFEITSLLSQLGFAIYAWFTLIAICVLLIYHDRPVKQVLPSILRVLFVSLQVILQTLIMTKAARLELLLKPEDQRPRMRHFFRLFVLWMAVFNLMLWISDITLLSDKAEAFLKILECFYLKSHWNIINNSSRPLILFYRFSCSLIFFKMYFA